MNMSSSNTMLSIFGVTLLDFYIPTFPSKIKCCITNHSCCICISAALLRIIFGVKTPPRTRVPKKVVLWSLSPWLSFSFCSSFVACLASSWPSLPKIEHVPELPNPILGHYLSFASFTTVGFGDVYATGNLRFLTVLESLTGLVLITWSASFIYLQMERYWRK